ncbi:DnaE-like DNA polymerase III [Streptomyces phage Tomas]|uniref:DNA-directed DNA polymerase n=1 Tax=Streptomyces phage Tomas TaxID=2914443 RepID=A0AA49BRR8_9CAUD|nr:DnaE-like DNA polymerase III [Streptomyces phage Tomas]UMO76272.1 DnaE-like DNA polymerase III [Streptomyces phage Tomas]
MNITELHLHDYYSALDGLNSPDEYMTRAKELGMTHLSQTNHGTLAGHRDFQRAAKAAGIVPILGVEAYISETGRFDRTAKNKRTDGTSVYNHLIILSQNETGLRTLQNINEIAWREGYYYKPRIDMEVLDEHNDGLIVLSGCLNGLICKALEAGNVDKAVAIAERFKGIFGERFFIEVQAHNPLAMNEGLLHIADSLDIRPVVTSDCHYARKEDLWIEEAMLILSTNPKSIKDGEFNMSKSQKMETLERFNYLYPDRTMSFQEIEIYLRSADEQRNAFLEQGIDRTDIITNTNLVAEMIGDYPYHAGLDLLPKPKTEDSQALLEKKAHAGLRNRGFANNPEYVKRLEEELDIIKTKDFSTYFLIVGNMVKWAKDQGIRVGPGRGSAAGSLVCYSLGITDVDPIEYGLLFFRFIDIGRDDWPDIDVDFADRDRDKVKQYLRRQYKHVAEIATINRFQGKAAVKAAARVYKVPIGEVNSATKDVDAPADKPDLFFDLFGKSDKGSKFAKKYPEVLELAHHLSGRIQSMGKHPAGIVVAKEEISLYAPIETAKDPNDANAPRLPIVAYDMNEAADIGLIKLDALGLKTLSVLDDALAMIKERTGKDIDLHTLNLNDSSVYQMLADGFTLGVFQAEGNTFTKWILEAGASEFNDLVIGTSIARPGPLNTVGVSYKARKKGKEKVEYDHFIMKKHTEETLGLIVYQEQVMQAMTDLAGMSMTEANKVRKIIGKKRDIKEFEQYRDKFVDGASTKVHRAVAEKLWHDFEQHAGYSFNKSHAVVYSMITYWTAYLKKHYPLEFMCALLKNEKDTSKKTSKLTDYLIEAKRLGIKVLLPHVNASDVDFSIEGNAIRFGITNVKYIRGNTGKRVLEHAPYASYADLREKVMEKGSGLTSRVLTALNAIGGAAFEDNPRTGSERDNFYEYLMIPAFGTQKVIPRVMNQFRSLDEYSQKGAFPVLAMVKDVRRGDGWARVELVDETGTAGVFTDKETPIEAGQMYAILVSDNRVHRYATMDELINKLDNGFVKYLYAKDLSDIPHGMYKVLSFQPYKTKAGKMMAYTVLADAEKNLLPVLAFSSTFHKAYGKCKDGAVIDPVLKQTQDDTYFYDNIL